MKSTRLALIHYQRNPDKMIQLLENKTIFYGGNIKIYYAAMNCHNGFQLKSYQEAWH